MQIVQAQKEEPDDLDEDMIDEPYVPKAASREGVFLASAAPPPGFWTDENTSGGTIYTPPYQAYSYSMGDLK